MSENSLYVTCAPGILLTTHAFLLENPSPTQAKMREALAGDLCCCTGYHFIVEAIEAAAQRAGAGRLALNPQEET
jgi:aerobic-type carbon monoxide dehydrogenase small subunit (CoxS/CutS family)